MRIGSLFSGAGGLDMAVEAVFGGEVVWHSEIDKAASKVLAHRYPDVPNLGDITEINWANWKPMLEVDVLCGGWPCQPFSLAGKQKGIHDERALWPYVARAIRSLRPRYVVLENVPAVLTAGEFDRVAADLAACGYEFAWTVLRASDVGAPHRRERLFVVATDPDQIRPKRGGLPDRIGATQSESCSGITPFPADAPSAVVLLPTPKAAERGNCPSEHNRKDPDLRAITYYFPTPTTTDGSGGGVHPDSDMSESAGPNCARSKGDKLRDLVKPMTSWGKYEPAIQRWECVTGTTAPAPTEPNKNGNPRLAAEFSSWLMGWPAGWVTDPAIGISRNNQLKICGNGVVPQQAAAAIRYLLAVTA